jgi:hypothetical protein
MEQHIGVSRLGDSVAERFPGYRPVSQPTNNYVVLKKAHDPAAEQSSVLPSVTATDATEKLIQNIAANSKPGSLRTRALLWRQTAPQVSRVFARAGMKKHAPLDGSARDARRIIEAANNAKILPLNSRSNPRRMPGRAARPYDVLVNAHRRATISPTPSTAPTKTISLRELPRLVAEAAPAIASAARPLVSFAAKRLLPAPGMR